MSFEKKGFVLAVLALLLLTGAVFAQSKVLYERNNAVKIEAVNTEKSAALKLDPLNFVNYFYDRFMFFSGVFNKLDETTKDEIIQSVYTNLKTDSKISVTYTGTLTKSRNSEVYAIALSADGNTITVTIPKESRTYVNVDGRMIWSDYMENNEYRIKKETTTEKYDLADYYIFNQATDDDQKPEAILKEYYTTGKDEHKKFITLLALSQYYISRSDDVLALDYLKQAEDFSQKKPDDRFMQMFLVMGKDLRRMTNNLRAFKPAQ